MRNEKNQVVNPFTGNTGQWDPATGEWREFTEDDEKLFDELR